MTLTTKEISDYVKECDLPPSTEKVFATAPRKIRNNTLAAGAIFLGGIITSTIGTNLIPSAFNQDSSMYDIAEFILSKHWLVGAISGITASYFVSQVGKYGSLQDALRFTAENQRALKQNKKLPWEEDYIPSNLIKQL